MQLSFPPREPDPEAPLEGLPDNVQALIQSHTKLMGGLKGELVFLLDGEWGSGKTTLVKAWKAYLEKEKKDDYKVIYIDAFLHDFNNDPLFMIGKSLINEIGGGESKENFRMLLKGFKPLVAGLISVTAGPDISNAADAAIDYLLKKEDREKQVKHYRKKLEQCIGEKKIVIFIDELDRCRPDFSIATLEKIKHIFSVEGIIFILVANTTQLNASLKGIYGPDIDAEEYWKKLIGHTIYMPPIENYRNLSFLKELYASVAEDVKKSEPVDYDAGVMKFYSEFLNLVAAKQNLSYRQLQKLHLEICFSLINGATRNISVILIYLRCQYRDLYRDLRNQSYQKGTFFKKIDYLNVAGLYTEENRGSFFKVVPPILALVKVISPQEYGNALKECREVLDQKICDHLEQFIESEVREIYRAGYDSAHVYNDNDIVSLSTIASICRRLDKFELATN